MFLIEIFASNTGQKHASFCFGRMNPPTSGHGQLIKTVEQASNGGNYFIFTGQSQDEKKNPLDYKTKIDFLRALFPKYAPQIIYDKDLRTIMDVAQWLYEQDYTSVTFVAGSDRLPQFQEILTKYNGHKGAPVYYNFANIQFVSSGERDPDAEGLEGVSGTKAREAAAAGDLNAFARATGAGRLSRQLYSAVRKGMNLSEDAAGVGVVAKNRRMAKDPRWSHSLTKDVRPNTPNKNARALRLI